MSDNDSDIEEILEDALKDSALNDGAPKDGEQESGGGSDHPEAGAGQGDGGASAEIDSLKQEIEAARDRYLRLMAEFDNYKRRTAKEYERLIESANEKLMLEIVDVRENFERALKAGEAGGEFAPFFDGMKLIFAKLDETLLRNGLTVFADTGDPFDPAIHDALMNTTHADIPSDHIAEVFERGYRLKDKVVKHARVIVSSGKPDGE
jgi:molecular chaperone GrpE